jgi:hypothetical protein
LLSKESSRFSSSAICQGKVEMSPSRQSRNAAFLRDGGEAHVMIDLPVKRRRALLASNPIKE